MLYNAGVSGITARLRARPMTGDRRVSRFVGNTAAAADSQRLADSRRVVDAFLAQLPARSGLAPSRILVLVDGMRRQLYEPAELERAAGSYFDLMRRYLLENAPRAGYEVLDMQARFIERHQRDGAVFEFLGDNHWNSTGHEEAAAAVAVSRTYRRALGVSTAVR
jgi:hypothetical protein